MSDRPARRRLYRWSLRSLFFAVTLACCLAYQLRWIHERKLFVTEWRAKGGNACAGPAPLTLRMLGAEGISRFEYGYFGFNDVSRPVLSQLEDEARQRLETLFPEAQVAKLNNW